MANKTDTKAADVVEDVKAAPAPDAESIAKAIRDGREVTQAYMNNVILNTREALAKQPKRTIRIRAEKDPKAPNYETVCVNGLLFQIMKGVDVDVPETVYDILSEANII